MTQFINSTLTGSSNLVNPATDDDIYITETGNVLATTGTAITAGVTIDIRIFGTLAGSGAGLSLQSGGDVFVGETGQVSGRSAGISLSGFAQIVNYGAIVALFNGIAGSAANGTLTNYGSITGFDAHGVEMNLENGSVNYGSITGNQAIDIFRNDDVTSAVAFDNYGTLTGTGGRAVDGDSGNPDYIFNAGTINGDVALEGGDNILTNTEIGVIKGDYRVDNDNDTFTNDGALYGDVLVSGGNDTVTNSGIVSGEVLLEAGDDTYTAIGSGSVVGEIDGGIGNDTLTGGSNADFIDGGDDNDRLFGRGGDDDLRGGNGSDYVSAGMGNDYVEGADGADKIFGSGGEDTLQGGRDKDTIRGGDGEDEINGGRSQDVLRGGDGADVFLYQFRQDSTVNLADTIQDFQLGIDRIDLDALNVAFVGSAAFSGTAQEVRYEIGTDGRTFVEVDTDANGSADMRINLTTVGVLTEDDFIL